MIAVDVLMNHGWSRGKSCHLISLTDDLLELDDFAASIGLRREWRDGDHYDLTASKRALAVLAGAREVTRRDQIYIEWIRHRRRARLTPTAPTNGEGDAR